MSATKAKTNPWPAALRELRRQRNWTQRQAAEAVGIPLRTWINYENDSMRPGSERRRRFRELFQLDPLTV